jgi:hypothetical protein
MTDQPLINATPFSPDMRNRVKENAEKQQKTTEEKRVIGRPFPKGVSGNPAGRPKRKTLTELIHEKLDKTPDGWDNLVKLVLVQVFNKRDKEILKELWHYTDGMPKQSTDLTSGGKPLPNPIYGGKSTDK